jgi:hypothetical protein
MIGGDWNLEHEQLAAWADTLNLTNFIYKNTIEKYYTRRSGLNTTCIDHILHNSTISVSSGFINYATFGRSDHFPIFNTVTLNEPFYESTKGKQIKIKQILNFFRRK